MPSALLGGKARGYGGPPEQAGRAFLKDHKQLFGIENAQRNLEVARINASKGNTRVLYRQMYEGVPVLHSGYLVAVDADGAVYYVSGDYHPDLRLPSTSPSMSVEAVVRHMRSDLQATRQADGFEIIEEPELVVYVDDGRPDGRLGREVDSLSYHLAYVAKAERRSPLAAYNKYVIHAQTGEVLFKTSLVMDVDEHGRIPVDGVAARSGVVDETMGRSLANHSAMINKTGKAYATNPLRESSPGTVTLHRLRNVYPRELYGYEVDINDRFDDDAPLKADGTFEYDPSSHYFDQVMVYYHSDVFMVWLAGRLGWHDNIGEVDAETRTDECYACTLPSQQDAFYSDGSNYVWRNPTREASVMAHEQMHIVSQPFHDLETGFWGRALDEGYSDYFAVAYRHDRQGGQSTEVGEYALVSSDVDHNRQLNNTFSDRFTDNDDDGDEDYYDASLVFTGALWDFTTDIASSLQEAATITLGSLEYLDADPSFLDARDALVAAATDVGRSQYECGIRETFADHGIGTACPPLSVSISGPSLLDYKETGTFTASASGGGCSSYGYHWYYRDAGQSYWSDTYDTDDTYQRTMLESDFEVKATATCNGTTEFDTHYVTYSGGIQPKRDEDVQQLEDRQVIPQAYALEAAYPNPFNPRATIRFALPEESDVELVVYDALGREVARLVDGPMQAGHHEAVFEAGDLPSGVYLYELRAGGFTETGRVVLAK